MPRIRYFNASIKNLIYRLRKFDYILDEELENEIRDNMDFIIDAIARQMEEGYDGNDKPIRPPYSDRWKKVRQKVGLPIDRVTLKFTGDFHNSLYVEYGRAGDTRGGFKVYASDEKAKYLISRYGKQILKLSDENLKELLWTRIRPSLAKKLKKRYNIDT